MRLPDFLIIGAMKAGTTSLYRDLDVNPAVFLATDKEPGDLARDAVRHPRGLARYARHFERAAPEQVCGEASTIYSQIPDHRDVPQRTREVVGHRVKVVYMVREPVAQIISHHRHTCTTGICRDPIDEAVRSRPRYLNYARYAMQAAPWIKTFGREQVLVVRFESYIEDRPGVVNEISRFLGVEPRPDLVEVERQFNRSDGKPVPRGPFAKIQRSFIYRRMLRPALGSAARDKLRHAVLPKALDRPDPPSAATVRFILDELRDDAEELRVFMGRREPVWDFDDILERHGGREAPAV